jgi:aspartyl aminopeptidase
MEDSMNNLWKTYSETQKKEAMDFAEDYIDFLSKGKTERVCVTMAIDLAKKAGYRDMNDIIKENGTLKPQDRVYFNIYDKALVLVQIGTDPIEKGMNILGAHVDSPRLDLKPSPVFERDDLAYMDTHYYGGIKKYQWLAMPLALYGTVYLQDGTKIDIAVGDKPEDPVFCITDLLPHLGKAQLAKPAGEFIEAEKMDLLVGHMPLEGEGKDAVKANVLAILKEDYGIEEEDFASAEFEVVPAGPARTMGFDRSMVLGYGQDDRACSYPALMAQLECGDVKRTAMTLLVDKEEIGSQSATGSQANYMENCVREILHAQGIDSELIVMRALANSFALSNDTTIAHDPIYPEVSSENGNNAVLGGGLTMAKYSGSRGKAGCNDANPEFIAYLRKVFNDADVKWQVAELGKQDLGGGGTIAWLMSKYTMQTIDAGITLLNIHAPWELASKADLYEAKRAYAAFLAACPQD